MLTLEAAYGSKRKEAVSFAPGEGLIGKAAKLKLIAFAGRQWGRDKDAGRPDHACSADRSSGAGLIGMLGLGRLINTTGDEKRLIAMVTDLAAVSLQNCEKLSTAQEEANTDPPDQTLQ